MTSFLLGHLGLERELRDYGSENYEGKSFEVLGGFNLRGVWQKYTMYTMLFIFFFNKSNMLLFH
jgi:hypothetical protein